ncbi:MAG: PD-(D/E)XK nuclease family protein, partial [Thermoplasmatota archaeon]
YVQREASSGDGPLHLDEVLINGTDLTSSSRFGRRELGDEVVPVVVALMGLLKLPIMGFRRRSVVEVLSSPFFSLYDDRGERITGQNLEFLTRSAGMSPIRRDVKEGWDLRLKEIVDGEDAPDDVRSMAIRCRGPLVGFLEMLEEMSSITGPVAGHLERVYAVLSHLHLDEEIRRLLEEGEVRTGSPPGDGPYQMNAPALQSFITVLRTVDRRSRLLSIGDMTFKELVEHIETEVSRGKVRSTVRVHGVQVMGLLEAAGLDLGTAYFMDLVEGSIPSIDSTFRILSDSEREEMGLPPIRNTRRELELLAMTVGSSDIPVICSHRTQDDRPVLHSSFIEDLHLEGIDRGGDPRSRVDLHRRIGELVDPATRISPEEILTVSGLLSGSGGDLQRLERGISSFRKRRKAEANEHSGRILDDDLLHVIRDRFGPGHVWSVTQFETYRKCPYQFLVRYLLKVEELEDLEPGIPPEKKGLIFHEVAERFYNILGAGTERKVTQDNLTSCRALIRKITDEVMGRYPNRGPYWDALRDQLIGSGIEKGLLDCFLEVEAAYQGNFLVERTELRFGLPECPVPAVRISLPGEETGPDSFLLRGSIDRLDVLATRDGELDFIWDYKTGRSEVDGESVQVQLYLAALRKLLPDHYPAGGGYYYVRRRGSVERSPVHGEGIYNGRDLDRDALQAHIRELGEEVQETVRRCLEMMDAIRAGDLSGQAACRERYCSFNNLCRRGDP